MEIKNNYCKIGGGLVMMGIGFLKDIPSLIAPYIIGFGIIIFFAGIFQQYFPKLAKKRIFKTKKLIEPIVINEKIPLDDAIKELYNSSNNKIVCDSFHEMEMSFDIQAYLLGQLRDKIQLYGEIQEGYEPTDIPKTMLLYPMNKPNCLARKINADPHYYNVFALKKDFEKYFH